MRDYLHNFAETISEYLPSLIGALLVLLIGWLLAKGIKTLVIRVLKNTSLDEKILGKAQIKNSNAFVGNIIYYLVMIVVIMIVLEILGVNQVLTPVENMVDEVLEFIPNVIGAALIVFVGYLLGKFISNLINLGGNLVDKLVDKTGFKNTETLVSIIRKVVFIAIFIPFLIQGFNALNIDSISGPANAILTDFTFLIGDIIIAGAILVLFIWGGKYLAHLLEDLLKSIKLDLLSEKIQLHNIIGDNQSLSKILANLMYFFLVFFGIITAVEILGLTELTETLDEILNVTGNILFGLIILVIGNYISILIQKTVSKSNNNTFIGAIVRWASLALFIAISLRTMGIANEIVELAFALIFGAIAVTIALSYGLGGREAAGEHFKEIIKKLKSKDSSKGEN